MLCLQFPKTTRSALILFFVSAVLFVSLTGCPTPGAGPSTTGTGEIIGHARFAGALNSSGILISADSVDSKGKTLAVTRAIKTRSVAGSKSLAGQTTTDASGAYSLTGLAAGTYTIYASSQNSVEKAVRTGVTVVAGKDVTATDLNLTPTGQISGVATLNGASSGNLGIVVFVAGTSFAAMTDDTGAYTISSVPAATGYTLVGSMNGYNSMETSVDVAAGATTSAPTMNLTIPVPTPTTGSVTGTAELNGAMSGNTGIFVYLAESPYITMTSSDSGAFSITGVAPGTYIAVASMVGYGTVSVQSVTVSAGNATNVGIMNLVSAPNGFRFTPWNQQMSAIVAGNGILVAVGNGAMNSSDGVTWTNDSSAPTNGTCVTYANGVFIAGDDSGYVYQRNSSSAGSSTWSNGISVSSSQISSIAYGTPSGVGTLVAVDSNGNASYSTNNGASWTTVATGAANLLWCHIRLKWFCCGRGRLDCDKYQREQLDSDLERGSRLCVRCVMAPADMWP